jgi:cobalamin biosynthesis protein CobW
MMTDGVAIDIVTGFLGSGKTTLLRHILEHGLEGRRVAVIMNEIGDIGIDGRTIEGMNVEQMIELGSGCVCCTISRHFGLALQEIVETVAPELIIVETTGVADPPNIVYETKQVGYSVDAIVTVVDALNFERHLGASEVTRGQVAAADFIVLNKVDLVDGARLAGVESEIRSINARAHVVRARHGAVDPNVIFGTAARSHLERLRDGGQAPDAARSPRDHGHLERDRISAFTYESNRPFVRERFERFLAILPGSIYRAKGLVTFTESEWSSLFNFTCGRAEYEWREKVGPDFMGQSVFIGAGAADLRGELSAQLDDCSDFGF